MVSSFQVNYALLIDIMQYAVSLEYHLGLVTNGMLFATDIIARLKKTELKTIAISIDGLHETHNSIFGVRDALKVVIQNLHLLAYADFLETIMIISYSHYLGKYEFQDHFFSSAMWEKLSAVFL